MSNLPYGAETIAKIRQVADLLAEESNISGWDNPTRTPLLSMARDVVVRDGAFNSFMLKHDQEMPFLRSQYWEKRRISRCRDHRQGR